MDAQFFISSILLGAGLAVDAFSVSCANALREPGMRCPRMSVIAGVYGSFQFLMPLAGWVCVHTIRERFTAVQPWIPWIAFVLLAWIGGKMLCEGVRQAVRRPAKGRETELSSGGGDSRRVPASTLLLQGIATSIDALSVGFTIAGYRLQTAFASCLIIGAVTYGICMGGLAIGKKAGLRLTGKADLLGGLILIVIGILNVIR